MKGGEQYEQETKRAGTSGNFRAGYQSDCRGRRTDNSAQILKHQPTGGESPGPLWGHSYYTTEWRKYQMIKRDMLFWMLTVSFIFGVALNWPVWCKFFVIIFSGGVLFQVSSRLFKAYKSR